MVVGKLLQERNQFLEILRLEIDDDVPAELGDLVGDAEERPLSGSSRQDA
jgi:hypothetical protein